MSDAAIRELESAIAFCLEARERLDPNGLARTRLLLDMLLFELGRDLAKAIGPQGG